jgi:hypothetical protein
VTVRPTREHVKPASERPARARVARFHGAPAPV